MNNNHVFKTILLLTGLSHNKPLIQTVFKLAGYPDVSQSKIRWWRAPLDNPKASPMPDFMLQAFFDGLFTYRDMMGDQGVEIFDFPIEEKG